jgi:hypothetical protein
MSVKPATGAVTQHSTNKQNERGSGPTNVPLKKSTANPPPAGMKKGTMAQPEKHGSLPRGSTDQGDRAPGLKEDKRVIYSEAEPHGRNTGSRMSTFRAPRNDSGSHDPLTAGYTKPGKMK